MKNLNFEQKINQLFILGYEKQNYEILFEFLMNGLGGVIFFTQNIYQKEQIKNDIKKIKSKSLIKPFLSIDQEGGRVERTENIFNGKKFLSAMFAYKNGVEFLKAQTEQISDLLIELGFNMNFSPVVDVNTNSNNPIIGERAFSSEVLDVCTASKIVYDIYRNNKIIPVIKHFPGHGDTEFDSHFSLPVVNSDLETLEKIHIMPFKFAIKDKIPAIMISHVNYKAFDETKIPASLSKNLIKYYLISKLKFDGLIISDDMLMGAIDMYKPLDACIKALKAGINLFIFRVLNEDVKNLLTGLKIASESDNELKKCIETSFNKIIKTKKLFL